MARNRSERESMDRHGRWRTWRRRHGRRREAHRRSLKSALETTREQTGNTRRTRMERQTHPGSFYGRRWHEGNTRCGGADDEHGGAAIRRGGCDSKAWDGEARPRAATIYGLGSNVGRKAREEEARTRTHRQRCLAWHEWEIGDAADKRAQFVSETKREGQRPHVAGPAGLDAERKWC